MIEKDDETPYGWCFKLPLQKSDLLLIAAFSNEQGNYSCNDCLHRANECDIEYSTADWPYCTKELPVANLKGFPFKRIPKGCQNEHFNLSMGVMSYVYWANEFVQDDPNRPMIMPRPLRILWRAEDRFGRIKLSERNQKRVAMALNDWRAAAAAGRG